MSAYFCIYMRSCRICGKTDKETQIINSIKYGMNLCRYHYKEMCNKHLDADNIIEDNYVIVNKIKFYFEPQYLSIIKSNKWFIKYRTNSINGKIPYLVNSSGKLLITMIYGKSPKGELCFGFKGYTFYYKDNIIDYQFKKIVFKHSEFGYKGVYQSQLFPAKYRYNIWYDNRLVSTKEFPRLELVIYLAYLVNKILYEDNSYDDEETYNYISKLNIVDKENIEKYFIKKFVSLNPIYAKRYTEYKKDIAYKNRLKYMEKIRFYNDL